MMPALGAEDKDKAGETEVVEKKPSGSLGELLTFAQPVDKLICVLAAVLFVAFGVAQILFIFFIKPFFDDVGAAESAGGGIGIDVVNQMSLMMLLTGVGIFCVIFPAIALANFSANRQKRAWQKATIKAILRQEIGWFDTSKPQELAATVSTSVELLYKALEGPVYMPFMSIGAMACGFYGGFSESWQIALVVLACFPIVIVAAGILIAIISKTTKTKTAACALRPRLALHPLPLALARAAHSP